MQKNLRELLRLRNMSVAELSRRTKVPAKTLYHWMVGQQPRKIDHLLRVCAVLETTVEELYGQVPSKRPPTFQDFEKEINTGLYEVILRPVKKAKKEEER